MLVAAARTTLKKVKSLYIAFFLFETITVYSVLLGRGVPNLLNVSEMTALYATLCNLKLILTTNN